MILECKTADTSLFVDCDGSVVVYGEPNTTQKQALIESKNQSAQDLLTALVNEVPVIEGPPGQDGLNGQDALPISVVSTGNGQIILGNTTQGEVTITLPRGADGLDGQDGENGQDGISVSHAWNGTALSITSASGTSSVDLKGEKGDAASLPTGGSPGQILSINEHGQYIWIDPPSPPTMGASAVVRFKGGISDCPVTTDCPIIGSFNVARVHHYKHYYYRIHFKTPMSNNSYAFNSRGGAWWGSNQSGSEVVEEKNHTKRTKEYIEVLGTDYVNAFEYVHRGQVFIYDLKN
ncbi:hypothetical protein [Pseudoalteromonas viridis]|uniref:Uncharacterized protein n=1 Tax=Pseudoalteromonas viridis TaxID=339617 RepID=A0ABX7V5N7_9GAMM|nr:hypothetical protein [Pseudoalteromonas viridis]QTL35116.1 hypothetical protein J5X90_16545 [Pseudoalteromonas viridis]